MKRQTPILVIVVIIIILAITNPNMEDYKSYVRGQITQAAQKEIGADNPLSSLVGAVAGSMLDSITTRQNFIVFSVYESALGHKHLKVLAFFGQFVTLRNDLRDARGG